MINNIYLESGFLNFPNIWKNKCPFIWLFGGRGCGKTYSVIKFLTERNMKFIYMRRTSRQIELSCLPKTSPFKKINEDFGRNILPRTDKEFVYFREGDKDIAFGAALSTFYNLRGVSLDDYDVLFFDEVIPEVMERPRRGEGRAMLDAIETINRNRELLGRKPLRCIFCGNTDTLDSDILRAFGIIGIVENMVARGKEVYINRDTGHAVYNLYKSPISEQKANTALYRATQNEAFRDKALHNIFADLRDSNDIRYIPIAECKIFCNIDSEIGIYEHKSNEFFYVCATTNKGGKTFHMINAADRRSFARTYGVVLREAIDGEKIYYDSFQTKSALENYLFNY